MHAKYLKEHKRTTYDSLFFFGRLNAYLHEANIEAQEMFDRLVKENAERQGVTEKLKAGRQMEWVGRMNNIRHCAKEIVLVQHINV